MKFFWLLLAAPAWSLIAQTNPAPAPAITSLWAMPPMSLHAPTNLAAPEPSALTNAASASIKTNLPVKEPSSIRITSKHGVVDMKNHVVVYSGDVVVTNIQMKMTCDQMTASAPTNSTQIDNIVAEGNVKIEGADNKGRPIHAKSDKAIYLFTIVDSVTNKTMTLTGNVYVDSANGTTTADPIMWDLITDKIHMENTDMRITPDTKDGTNAPLAKPFGKSFP